MADGKPITRKGVTYFPTFEAARAAAIANGWPTDRIISYSLGWAVQQRKGGPYYHLNPSTGMHGSKLSPATYGYRVNLHERGEFSADVVEDDGHELCEVRSDPDDESIVHEIDDGWMRHTGDLVGLTDYLVHLGIIAAGSRILPMSQAEAQWERTRPAPRAVLTQCR